MSSSATFTSNEPHEFAAFVRGGEVQLAITACGAYRAQAQRIGFHDLWMQRLRQSLPHVARVRLNSNRSVLLFPADFGQPAMHWNDRMIAPGDLVILSCGAEYYNRASAASRLATMSLPPEALAEVGRVLVGYDLRAPPVTRIVRRPVHEMSRLMSLHNAVGDLVAAAPSLLAHAEVAKSIEQSLVYAMVRCLTNHTDTTELRGPGLKGAALMKRFEELLEARGGQPVYLAECCAELGVSDRTLRRYCQEHVGMGAHRYLWLRRMHLARAMLVQADRITSSVTTVANDCGFGELGRFAVTFRQLFGESPSATLNRPPNIDRSSADFFHQRPAVTA
jgi:AraC-like DNA-binding protein